MMDYVFTPLNFVLRKFKKRGLILSIIVTFLLVGLWNGANWTFIVFGLMHGLYFIPLILKGSLFRSKVIAKGRFIPNFREILGISGLFLIVAATTIVFRADNISDAYFYFGRIFSESLFTVFGFSVLSKIGLPPVVLVILVGIFFLIEWAGREGEYAIELLGTSWRRPVRWSFYYLLIMTIIVFSGSHQQFIYFQF
jgi:D-alanyl-lipoteichoic acid acyltransferase DltB (MBOAT superfamily)